MISLKKSWPCSTPILHTRVILKMTPALRLVVNRSSRRRQVRIAEQAATRLSAEVGLSQPSTEVSPAIIQRKRMLQAALVLFVVSFWVGEFPWMFLPRSCLWEQQPACLLRSPASGSPSGIRTSAVSSRSRPAARKHRPTSVVLSCVACHLQSSAD